MLAEGSLSFKTALQNVTAQSTLEAELISMAHASKDAVYLSNMMAELGFGKLFESVPLFGDNTGALHIAGNSTYSSRTEHIALRFLLLEGASQGRQNYHPPRGNTETTGRRRDQVPDEEHASAPTEPYRGTHHKK